ncbi:MAG: DnaD domain protein [Dehalococcoidia bacterium]|nr:MAG: DnaD domain protein [Dehalococcoidia bacterium]
MKSFGGFPANMQFTPIPNLFMNMLMPGMDNPELKTMLYIFQTIYGKKGTPRFATLSELLSNPSLTASLQHEGKSGEENIKTALESAVKRGAIISLAVTLDGKQESLYFLNTASDREAVERIKSGELKLPKMEAVRPAVTPTEQKDVFSLYEENIGMLTPMIAEEIKDALTQYPEEWIRDAVREAVDANKRNWRYIARILERWTTEGKKDGTHRRDNQKEDPDKYIRGPYGHLIQR